MSSHDLTPVDNSVYLSALQDKDRGALNILRSLPKYTDPKVGSAGRSRTREARARRVPALRNARASAAAHRRHQCRA